MLFGDIELNFIKHRKGNADNLSKLYDIICRNDMEALRACKEDYNVVGNGLLSLSKDFHIVVILLAKHNQIAALNFLHQIITLKDEETLGFAWGNLDTHQYNSGDAWRLQGYGLGRNIAKINEFLDDKNNGDGAEHVYVYNGLKGAGYPRNYDEAIELITLIHSHELKESIADLYVRKTSDSHPETLLITAKKIQTLMQQSTLNYEDAKKIVLDTQNLSNNSSALFFENAVKKSLPVFQKYALDQLSSQGLTADMLLSWQPADANNPFSSNHYQALAYLINGEHLMPSDAIKEISGLNAEQVNALQLLYAKNLRGDDLRAQQKANPQHIFKPSDLEHLLKLCLESNVEPKKALEQIHPTNVKLAIPVRRI